ncbi:MAG: shikimate dehydrogenase [Parvibaculaceae bacterium]
MIGKPLSHVRSPYLLRDLIRADGGGIAVTTEELDHAGLAGFMALSRKRDGVLGLIVTTPLKSAVCAHADRLTADAAFIGAANCLRRDGAEWLAANFDGYGFANAFTDRVDIGARPRILLIGCGAAGSAIAASLVSIAEIDLVLFDREPAKAEDFAARLRTFAPKSAIRSVAQPMAADIVVNASTAGMENDDESPVPDAILERARVVGDIVIRDTALKRAARERGKTLIEGEAMVRGQARLLYRFLTGRDRSEREALAACGRAG